MSSRLPSPRLRNLLRYLRHPRGHARPAPKSEIDGQWSRGAAIHTPRGRDQHFPPDNREVPSPHVGRIIWRSPLDPAANLAGAFRGLAHRRSLSVVSRPQISQQFQKFALIVGWTLARHAPHRVSKHPPLPCPEMRMIAQNRPEIRRAP